MLKKFMKIIDQEFDNIYNAANTLAEAFASHWCEENGLQCRSPAEAMIVYKRYQDKLSSGKINSIPEFRRFIDDEQQALNGIKTIEGLKQITSPAQGKIGLWSKKYLLPKNKN